MNESTVLILERKVAELEKRLNEQEFIREHEKESFRRLLERVSVLEKEKSNP